LKGEVQHEREMEYKVKEKIPPSLKRGKGKFWEGGGGEEVSTRRKYEKRSDLRGIAQLIEGICLKKSQTKRKASRHLKEEPLNRWNRE